VTFFQRFKTPFTDSAADDQMRSQPRMRLVGEFLQERREDLGLDLDEIGAMLRIKPAYLAALEQGRSHDLPGPTYAIGFIRAYADFLGLDADQVLVRFKAEAAGATARPDLALPVPLGERSLPGGALVLVALIVALCGYGIWYYLSTDERDRPQRVAAVPAALQTAPVVAPALVSPGDATAASSAANSPPAQASTAPVTPPPLFGAAATPVNAPAAAPPAGPPPSPQAASPGVPPSATRMTASAAPTQPGGPVAAPGAPPPPAANAAPRVAAVTAPGPATQSPATQPTGPPLAAAKPVPASAPAAPAAPAAADPAATRIAIRALSDCWIQVRGPDQAIVFSRVLKSGEVYKVPSRTGLSLRTGNAGALEIAVDGKPAPGIGGVGTLRRDVVLDPAELAAGTAVHG
jgi:cytoskeletal protein RodZ